MKIVSKVKDYYDYLVSKYGIDEKIVLDRTKFYQTSTYLHSSKACVNIYICDYLVQVYWTGSEYICGEKLKECKFFKSIEPSKKEICNSHVYLEGINKSIWLKPIFLDSKPNSQTLCPIMIETLSQNFDYEIIHSKWSATRFNQFPILKDYNIASVMDADTIYCLLIDFLSKDRTVINPLTDKQKIVSNGFDLKSSFRNVK